MQEKKSIQKILSILSVLFVLSFLVFCMTLLPTHNLNARIQTIDWGKENWENSKSKVYLNNTQQIQASDRTQDIILKENETTLDPTIDLLIHFNEDPVQIEGPYRIHKKDFQTSYQNKAFGTASAKFYRPKQELVLEPLEGSIFLEKNHLGDFTIDFWLKPQTLMQDEVVFRYGGPVLEKGKFLGYAGILCKIQNRKLNWIMDHLFYLPGQNQWQEDQLTQIQISGRSRLKQGKWQHHALSFQSIDGRMSYFVDGKLESEQVLTSQGLPKNTVLNLRFRSNSLLSIGTSFLGYIDEWIISRVSKLPKKFLLTSNEPTKAPKKTKPAPYLRTHNYIKAQGTVLSSVYDLGHPQTKLRKLNTRFQEFHGNVILFSYRMSPRSFSPDLSKTVLPWNVLRRDDKLNRFWIPENSSGRYFQWRAILKSEGNSTPILQEISFELDTPTTISSPEKLRALAQNDAISLNWLPNLEENLAGYRIYFGFESGNYLTPQAPIWIDKEKLQNSMRPNYLLRNLRKGRGYFFVIRAVDQNQMESKSSNEAYVYLQE